MSLPSTFCNMFFKIAVDARFLPTINWQLHAQFSLRALCLWLLSLWWFRRSVWTIRSNSSNSSGTEYWGDSGQSGPVSNPVNTLIWQFPSRNAEVFFFLQNPKTLLECSTYSRVFVENCLTVSFLFQQLQVLFLLYHKFLLKKLIPQ